MYIPTTLFFSCNIGDPYHGMEGEGIDPGNIVRRMNVYNITHTCIIIYDSTYGTKEVSKNDGDGRVYS